MTDKLSRILLHSEITLLLIFFAGLLLVEVVRAILKNSKR